MYNSPRIDASNNGTTHDPKSVNPVKDKSQSRNNFDISYRLRSTERFADITPFMVADLLPGDMVPFVSNEILRTPTFQAPLEEPLWKRKFYALVPQKAIMPETWKLFYANPTHGDDVPDDAYPSVNLAYWWRKAADALESVPDKIRFVVATELLFSVGALPSYMKCNLWPFLYNNRADNIDIDLDLFYANLAKYVRIKVQVQPEVFVYYYSQTSVGVSPEAGIFVNIHSFLDILRSGNYISLEPFGETEVFPSAFVNLLDSFIDRTTARATHRSFYELDHLRIDLSRFAAYQITCMSQATDPAIDYVFNAELWLNYCFQYKTVPTFSYNGRTVLYDRLSAHVLESQFLNNFDGFCDTIYNLFNFNKSLKYGDYFTTARPEPLAVGDINIDVNNDSVNALETARKLVYTRFLNWNNRVGPKYEDYTASLNGVSPMPTDTEPAYINVTERIIKGYDVENTGSEQRDDYSVTSQVHSSSNQFGFDIFVSEPSIVLGLSLYDIPRLYTRGVDKSFFKRDRFDFFNRKLQYTGDQEINAREFDVRREDAPVAYTTKDMQYKMAVSHACGGFIFALPSFSFTQEIDNLESLYFGINPMFIRNDNGSFDAFFTSVSGLSLGTYFHFVCWYRNDFSGTTRLMDVAPDIL